MYAAEPILQIPDEGYSPLDNKEPGAFVYYEATQPGRILPLDTAGDTRLGSAMIQGYRDSIMDGYFVNQLQLIDKREMTAAEVRARQAENARILGPTFGTLNYEFLAVLIDRVIDILGSELDNSGEPVLPRPPQDIQGKNLKLKFVSPLAKAQRLHEGQSISITVNTAMQWSQANPAVLDNIDLDAAIRTLADVDGSPPNILRDAKVVEQIRLLRAQAQAAQARAQMEAQQASTLKDGAKGLKDIDTVIGE